MTLRPKYMKTPHSFTAQAVQKDEGFFNRMPPMVPLSTARAFFRKTPRKSTCHIGRTHNHTITANAETTF